MKTIAALAFLLSTPTFALTNIECSDLTFAYNKAHVIDGPHGIEISIEGQNLDLPTLRPS